MIIKSSGYYIFDRLDNLYTFIRGILLTSKDIEDYINVDDVVSKRGRSNFDFNSIFNHNMREYGFEKFYAISEADIEYIIALCNVSIGN